jgi:hypothetical protein
MGVAIGCGNSAYGQHAIAMGGNGSANAKYESNTNVYANRAFGWSGKGSKYDVKGDDRIGSFNINPLSGLNGFYIGNDDFVQCVLLAVQKMDDS